MGKWGGEQRSDGASACRLTKDGDTGWVTAERCNAGMNPLEGSNLVCDTEIAVGDPVV